MKVLVVSTNGIIRDGITAWMIGCFSAMDRTGIEIHAVAHEGADETIAKEAEGAGIKVHVLPHRGKHAARYLVSLCLLLSRGGFDAIHVCGNSATMVLELFAAKVCAVGMRIAHVHNTVCKHHVADTMLRPMFYRVATDYYACGRDAGRYMYGDRPFTVIPNGKDVNLYAFDSVTRHRMREKLGVEDGQIVVGHIGTFNEQKNHLQLLRIFKELRERSNRYQLVLVGDGIMRSIIESTIRELGLEDAVTLLGKRADVPDLLNAMDCMVFPSLFEGFPNVVVEWQINGLPSVISNDITDECALTDLVRFELLKDTPSDWADTVEAALASSDRAADSARAGREVVQAGFDIFENAKKLKQLYLEGASR